MKEEGAIGELSIEEEPTEDAKKEAEKLVERLKRDFAGLSAVGAVNRGRDRNDITQAIKIGVITDMGDPEALPRLDMVYMVLKNKGGEPALRAVLTDPQCRRYVDRYGENCLHSIVRSAPYGTEAQMFVCATECMPKEEVVEKLLSPNSAGETPVNLARSYGLVALAQVMEDFISKHSEAKPIDKTKDKDKRDRDRDGEGDGPVEDKTAEEGAIGGEPSTIEEPTKEAKEEEEKERLKRDFAGLSAVDALIASYDKKDITQAIKLGVITAMGNLAAVPHVNMVEMVLEHGGGEQALRAVLADPRCRRYVSPFWDNCFHSIVRSAPLDTAVEMFDCATECMSAEEVVAALYCHNSIGETPVYLARYYHRPTGLLRAMEDFISKHLKAEPIDKTKDKDKKDSDRDGEGEGAVEEKTATTGAIRKRHAAEEPTKDAKEAEAKERLRRDFAGLSAVGALNRNYDKKDITQAIKLGVITAMGNLAAVPHVNMVEMVLEHGGGEQALLAVLADHQCRQYVNRYGNNCLHSIVISAPYGKEKAMFLCATECMSVDEVVEKLRSPNNDGHTPVDLARSCDLVALAQDMKDFIIKHSFAGLSAVGAANRGCDLEDITRALELGVIRDVGDPETLPVLNMVYIVLTHGGGERALRAVLSNPHYRRQIDSMEHNCFHLILQLAPSATEAAAMFHCATQCMSPEEVVDKLLSGDSHMMTPVDRARTDRRSGFLPLAWTMERFIRKHLKKQRTLAWASAMEDFLSKHSMEQPIEKTKYKTREEKLAARLKQNFAGLSALDALNRGCDYKAVTQAIEFGAITDMGDVAALLGLNMVEMVLTHGGTERALRAVLADSRCRRYVDPHGDNCLHSILRLRPYGTDAAEAFRCATQCMPKKEVVEKLLSPNSDGVTPLDLGLAGEISPIAFAVMGEFISDYAKSLISSDDYAKRKQAEIDDRKRKLREKLEKQKLLRDYRFIGEVALLAVLVCHGCVVFADSSFSFSKLKTSPLLCAHVVFLCIAFVYLLSVILHTVVELQRVGRGAANITNAESTEIVAADSVTTMRRRGGAVVVGSRVHSWWRGIGVLSLCTFGFILAILPPSLEMSVAYVVLSCFYAIVGMWILCMFCTVEPSVAVSSTPVVIYERGQQREIAGSSNSEGKEVVSNGNASGIPPATSVVGSLKVEEGSKTAITGSVGTGENVEENEDVAGAAGGGKHR